MTNTTAEQKNASQNTYLSLKNLTFAEYGFCEWVSSRKSSLEEKSKSFHKKCGKTFSDDFTVQWQVSQKAASWASFQKTYHHFYKTLNILTLHCYI